MIKWTGYIRFRQVHPEHHRVQRQMIAKAEAEESLHIRRIEVEIAGPHDDWPVLNEILNQLEYGYESGVYSRDGLIVCSLDRMAHSTDDLAQKMQYLREIKTPIKSIEDEITLFDYGDAAPSIPPLIRAMGTFGIRITKERAEEERQRQLRQKHEQVRLNPGTHSDQLPSLRRINEEPEQKRVEQNQDERKQLGGGSPPQDHAQGHAKDQQVPQQQSSGSRAPEQQASGGRPPALSEEELPELQRLMRAPGVSAQDICERFDISKTTLYRYVAPSGERRK